MNKQFLIIAIIAAIAIYLLGLLTCNGYYKNKFQCKEKPDTVVKYFPSDSGRVHYPKEDKVDSDWYKGGGGHGELYIDNGYPKYPITEVDSFIQFQRDTIHVKDTAAFNQLYKLYIKEKSEHSKLITDYTTIHSYTDTTHFDRLGIVKVKSWVGNDKLLKQQTILDSAFQTSTHQTISLKEKTQLWFGIDAYGNRTSYLNGAGASLFLKFRNIGLDGGLYFDSYNTLNWHLGVRYLIKLKK